MTYTIMRRIVNTSQVKRGLFVYKSKLEAKEIKRRMKRDVPTNIIYSIQKY